MRPSASHDLEWYFGSGSATRGSWASTSGLRSTFGQMLFVLSTGITYESECISGNAVEDALIARLADTGYARRIEKRLAQLDRTTYDRLRLHYSGGTFPGEVDVSALLAPSARALCLDQLRARLKKADKAKEAIEVHSLEHLVEVLSGGGNIPPELLRQVLRDASAVERAAVYAEAKTLVDQAKHAYETVKVPQ